MDYSVFYGSSVVGKATVLRRGLYYEVSCRCSVPVKGMYYIVVSCGEKQEDLGILVPEKADFVLKTRFPISRLGEGQLHFEMLEKGKSSGEFIPIREKEPFPCIEKLKYAHLETREGVLGAVIEGG